MSNFFKTEIKTLQRFKKTERTWHLALVMTLCIGAPLLAGYFFDKINYGLISSLGGFLILYMPNKSLVRRMITLLSCAFGFVLAYMVGICFSFNPYVSALVFGIFAAFIHRITVFFRLKSPGNFFFIMIASIASCVPFDLGLIPVRIGLLVLGILFACFVSFVYSLYLTKNRTIKYKTILAAQKRNITLKETLIVGCFMFVSLLLGKILNLNNPYWLPISTAAVMQGATLYHVFSRSYHRILGTLAGLLLAWILFSLQLEVFWICIVIIFLQFAVEIFIARNYAAAMIFMTPLTIFLADTGTALKISPNELILYRFIDIVIGSCIGVLAGWVLYKTRKKATPTAI